MYRNFTYFFSSDQLRLGLNGNWDLLFPGKTRSQNGQKPGKFRGNRPFFLVNGKKSAHFPEIPGFDFPGLSPS